MNRYALSELTAALVEIAWRFGPKGLNSECCDNLSLPEFRTLEKIAETKTCSVGCIGVYLGLTKSGATRIVTRLEKKGYINKMKDKSDTRVCCLAITKKGFKMIRKVDLQYNNLFESFMKKIPSEYWEQFESVLKIIAKTIYLK